LFFGLLDTFNVKTEFLKRKLTIVVHIDVVKRLFEISLSQTSVTKNLQERNKLRLIDGIITIRIHSLE
jgi:hypothetical protein